MNWNEVLDPEYGLQQDDYSLQGEVFGEKGQLRVVGWNGKKSVYIKYYVLVCSVCKEDPELFGEGVFRSVKGHLTVGTIPCGCSNFTKWSKEQYEIKVRRKANEVGFIFNGFVGEWKGANTKVSLTCAIHGEFTGSSICSLIGTSRGCPGCKLDTISKSSMKPDDEMITSFFSSGSFHPDTKFWRSKRKSSKGSAHYWHMSCPECGEVGEAVSSNLQLGKRSCACSRHRQKEAYINLVVDNIGNPIAIKFGIARDSKRRAKQQDKQSTYEIKNYLVYIFPNVASCKKAERECKKELICNLIPKADMKDGWSETTHVNNLDIIKSIYEKNGGVID